MTKPLPIGIIGCGKIFPAYAAGAKHYAAIDLVACADIDLSRAQARAKEFIIPKACSVEELLADPSIVAVINLTTPQFHASVNAKILQAGKHVYVEKPLAVTREDGKATVALAKQKNLMLSCAPDTFLGGGLQTCRKIIDEGRIGRVIGGVAVMACHGHESWHPDPEFYYLKGGGPLFDMGPYYITALVSLLGPVVRVSGSCATTFPTREITSQPKAGKIMPVEVPTHYSATLEFEQGAIITLIMSFDIWKHDLPQLQLFGANGSMRLPDPNSFSGPVFVTDRKSDWSEIPLTHEQGMRGAGIADLITGLASKRQPRAGGDLAYHVLDVMCAIEEAGLQHATVNIQSRCQRPKAIPTGLESGHFD